MKRIVCGRGLLAITLLAACKTEHNYMASKPDLSPKEIEAEVDAIQKVRMQLWPLETNTIPTPPGLPPQKVVSKKSLVRAQSVAQSRVKPILMSWDPSGDPFTEYRITIETAELGSWNWTAIGNIQTSETQINVAGDFTTAALPAGWYRLEIVAQNAVFLSSEPVTGAVILWKP